MEGEMKTRSDNYLLRECQQPTLRDWIGAALLWVLYAVLLMVLP